MWPSNLPIIGIRPNLIRDGFVITIITTVLPPDSIENLNNHHKNNDSFEKYSESLLKDDYYKSRRIS